MMGGMNEGDSPLSPNRYSVLPPVARSEADRLFIRELQHYIDSELEEIDSTDRKQRYIIHSAAFSKVGQAIAEDWLVLSA